MYSHLRMIGGAAILAAALATGGCLSVLPEPVTPEALIALPADRAVSPAAPLVADVSIFPPDATAAYSGVDIAVRAEQELVYLSSVRWADAAPRLLQSAVLESLAGSGGTGSATPAQLGARTDYELRWRIIDFSTGPDTAMVRTEVEASLLDGATRRVVAQQRFLSERNPAGRSARERAAALAVSAQEVADQVAAFVASSAAAKR